MTGTDALFPWLQSNSALVTLGSLVVAILALIVAFKRNDRRILTLSVLSESIIQKHRNASDALKILWHDNEIDSLTKHTITLSNIGNRALKSDDIKEPFTISIQPSVFFDITSQGIPERTFDHNGEGTIIYQPLVLLQPGKEAKLSILTPGGTMVNATIGAADFNLVDDKMYALKRNLTWAGLAVMVSVPYLIWVSVSFRADEKMGPNYGIPLLICGLMASGGIMYTLQAIMTPVTTRLIWADKGRSDE